jgi:hypothetical protein
MAVHVVVRVGVGRVWGCRFLSQIIISSLTLAVGLRVGVHWDGFAWWMAPEASTREPVPP